MSDRTDDTPDALAARYHAAIPALTVDPQTVLRAGRRRRSIRRVGVAAATLLGVASVSLAASALPVGPLTQVASQSPADDTSTTLAPQDELRALADQLDAQAAAIPTDRAFHFESTDWVTDGEGQMRMTGLERTSNPDGMIYQVESQTGRRDDLAVGDPMPADAKRTETGPTDQGRTDWSFEEDLPSDPAALRAAWLDTCSVDPSVGATEYRCVYVAMQETIPIATDETAASVLRLLADEPDVAIEEITDRLGRDRLAATFDLPGEGTVSYLVDPGTGRIDGMQGGNEHSTWVSQWTMEWIDPVSGF